MDPLRTIIPYEPKAAPNDLFAAVFFALSAIFLYHTVYRREWWALCLPIGCFIQAIGYINRVKFGRHPSAGLYFSGDLFVTVAPVAYLAFNYIIFARLCFKLRRDPAVYTTGSLTVLSNRAFTWVFVLSDVMTLLAQTAGGLMQIFASVAQIGRYLFIGGIIVQTISYAVFTAIVSQSYCHWTVSTINNRLRRACRRFYAILFFSSSLILLRSLYRSVELPMRPDGALARSEVAFFLLDVVPLFLAVVLYAPFWPSLLVSLDRKTVGVEFSVLK